MELHFFCKEPYIWLNRVVPEAVYEDPVTGYLSVAYGELIPVIIEALKEHLAIYQQDKQQIQTQLQDLRASIKKLHEANTYSKRKSGLQVFSSFGPFVVSQSFSLTYWTRVKLWYSQA